MSDTNDVKCTTDPLEGREVDTQTNGKEIEM